MYKKLTIALVIVSLIFTLLLGAWIYGFIWLLNNNVFVGFDVFPKNATYLNLTEKNISSTYYNKLHGLLPNCEIDWLVPFQGRRLDSRIETLEITEISDQDMPILEYFPMLKIIDATRSRDYPQLIKLQEKRPDLLVKYVVQIDGVAYSQDTEEISLVNLSDEEVALLDYLPSLKSINAQGCRDYVQLRTLQERKPEVEVRYTVNISGSEYPESTMYLTLFYSDISELSSQLENLPHLKTVHFVEPTTDAELLINLTESHPEIDFTWEKTVFGQLHTTEDTEFDFSGMEITLEDVEASMRFFPNAEKVIMSDCGIDNETMAAFREKMRSEYKVVWTVIVTGQRVRTDDTIFHSSGRHVSLVNEQSYDLYYCEDMIVVDVGHSMIKYIDWVKGMPNLKYLILADNWIKDITPIRTCKNLVYLELFINDCLDDISPLIDCTALEDVSVADTHVDLKPFAQMPWLKNLWVNNCGATAEERKLLTESLPNTHIEFDHGFTTGGGWRQLQNYFDMRDLMGLPYNTW